MLNWESPKTITKIRSLAGLVGYNKRFIEDFSKDKCTFDIIDSQR